MQWLSQPLAQILLLLSERHLKNERHELDLEVQLYGHSYYAEGGEIENESFFPLFLVKEKISGLRHFWVENISEEWNLQEV